VKLNADGTGTIVTGAQENGSGAVMALTRLAAAELGLQPEDFSLVYQDTDAGPWDVGSQGSQTTANNGRAVLAAAADLRRQLLERAADELEASVADLVLADGAVHVAGSPERSVTIRSLAARAHAGELLLGRGSGTPPSPPAYDGSGCSGRLGFAVFAAPSFSCHAARVRVDPATGVVRVLEHVAVHDFGTVLNPDGARGQVAGGVVHGLGIALSEGSQLAGGAIRNPTLLDYKLLTAADAPEIVVEFVDAPAPPGFPLGAKGVGEPPVIAPAGAVANAIRAACGAHVRDLPMTPQRVWAALHTTSEEDVR
jgi:CO/xanthine dehydrogenase Mo-binding subunit